MGIKRHNRITIICLLLLLAASATGAFARKDNRDDDADRRKASYLYISAIDAFMAEKYNLYGELITRAYELDPSDPELESRYGEWLMMTSANDSATVSRGFAMMKDAYAKMPADYYEGMQLIRLASNYRRLNDLITISEKLNDQFPDRTEIRLQLGRSYLMKALLGDTSYIAPALSVFSDLEKSLGKSPQLSELKIHAMAATGDTAAIIRELTDLDSSSPSDSYTALSVARIYNSISRPDSAKIYFDRACELDSTNGTAIMMRAQFYQQQGDSTTFDREAFRAIESRDLELDAKLKLIVDYVNMLYSDSTQYARIDNLFDTLLDVNPGEAEVHKLYASYLAETERYDRSAEQLEYAVSLDGSNSQNWLNLAGMHYNAGDTAGAIDALGRAAALFPGNPTIINLRATFLMLDKKYDDAISIMSAFPDSLLTEPEERSNHFSMLGDLYYRKNDNDSAFSAYKKALDANPANYMAMNNIAYYFAESDTLLDEAERYILRALRHEDGTPTTLDTYAWVLYKKGDYAGAKDIIDKTLELLEYDETADSLDYNIARDTAATQSETANTPAEEAAAEEPADPGNSNNGSSELFDHAGDIYFRYGDTDGAVRLWEEALNRNPDDPEAIKAKIRQRKIIDKDKKKIRQ